MQINRSHRADKANKRSRAKAVMKRAYDWGVNLANVKDKLAHYLMREQQEELLDKDGVVKKRKALIGSMTNWQYNQAGKKCKGAWHTLSTKQLEHFASLPHWKAKV